MFEKIQRGAYDTQSEGFKFITFMQGKFVERVAEDTPGSVARKLTKGKNEGKVVFETMFDTYTGQVYDIQVQPPSYGGLDLVLFIDTSTDEYPEAKVKLSLNMSSGPAKSFLSRLPVIDFSKDITLKGFNIENKEKPGKFNQYMVPYQIDGSGNLTKILPAFTRENPGELPQMEQIKVGGVLIWDDTKQLEFYQSLVENLFGLPSRQEPETVVKEDNIYSDELTSGEIKKTGKKAF